MEKTKQYDVFGIGSALMDILFETEDSLLDEIRLKKGQFHLIDEEKAKEIISKLDFSSAKFVPGGSASNTIAGISLLGGKGVFNGKVAEDDHGNKYVEETLRAKIKPDINKIKLGITGYALTFITPDSERTFAVHLGAASTLGTKDVFEEDIAQSKILHIEGYLFEGSLKEAALHAMETAKKHGTKISIDLGDPGVVKRNISLFRKVLDEYADIVFANELEAKEFTGVEESEALNILGEICETAIVKLGEKGSLIKHKGEFHNIPAFKTNAIDTTGAGDIYAAGVLHALAVHGDIKKGAENGALAASKVVSKIGARLTWEEIKETLNLN